MNIKNEHDKQIFISHVNQKKNGHPENENYYFSISRLCHTNDIFKIKIFLKNQINSTHSR